MVDWGLVKMGQEIWILAGWRYRRNGSEVDRYNLRKDKLNIRSKYVHFYIITFYVKKISRNIL